MFPIGDVLRASEGGTLKKFFHGKPAPDKSEADIPSSGFLPGGHTSLVDVHGDRMFAYDQARNCILCGEFKQLVESPRTPLEVDEEFKLSMKISFFVSRLVLRPESADTCMLIGNRGVVTVGFGYIGSEKLQITKETLIGNQLYAEHPQLEVVQCKWVPAASYKVIAILNSDYFLRVYNTETGDCLKVFCLGPVNTLPLVVKYNAEVDPETPVDFDFSVRFPTSKCWCMFALTASGTISCIVLRLIGPTLRCLIESYGSLNRKGPDCPEYGDGYSCILTSKEYPIMIVTGRHSGEIVHSLLLPTDSEEYELEKDMEENLKKNTCILHAKEFITLPLSEECSRSSMRILADPLHDERYICIHGDGVHLFTIKFLSEILSFLNTENNENKGGPNLSRSESQMIITWKYGNQKTKGNKMLGSTFTNTLPPKLLFVLQDMRTVLFNLPHPNDLLHESYENSKNLRSDRHDLHRATQGLNDLSISKDVLKISQNLLKNSANQPFLCGDQEISGPELSKLGQTTLRLKSDQLDGIVDAAQYLLEYVDTLEVKSDEMCLAVEKVLENRGNLKVVAERIAEQYQERLDQDEVLTKKLESVLFRYHQSFPVITDQEKTWIQTITHIKEETDALLVLVNRIKTKLCQLESTDQNLQVHLTPMQIRQIREEIENQNTILPIIILNLREIHAAISVG